MSAIDPSKYVEESQAKLKEIEEKLKETVSTLFHMGLPSLPALMIQMAICLNALEKLLVPIFPSLEHLIFTQMFLAK